MLFDPGLKGGVFCAEGCFGWAVRVRVGTAVFAGVESISKA